MDTQSLNLNLESERFKTKERIRCIQRRRVIGQINAIHVFAWRATFRALHQPTSVMNLTLIIKSRQQPLLSV